MLKLVDNWRSWWRMWSIRLNAMGLALVSWFHTDPASVLAVWNMMPREVRDVLPPSAVLYTGMALTGLSLLARLVKQPKIHEVKPDA